MSDLLWCATLKGAPRTKKTHQQIYRDRQGRPIVAPGKEFLLYQEKCLWQIRTPHRAISEAVNVKCLYYMETRQRVDLTNLLEATDDILVKAGVLADDCAAVVAGHDGSRVLLDRKNPRVEIEISKVVQQPCPRCSHIELPQGVQAAHSFALVGDGLYYYDADLGWEGEKINYCPWCGRPLK